MEIWILLWLIIGLAGYLVLINSMLKWDSFDWTYIMMAFVCPIAGPLIWIVAFAELHNRSNRRGGKP